MFEGHQHLHDPEKAAEFARALGLMVGGAGHPFVGDWGVKGLYAYHSGKYKGIAYFGTGGSERDRLTMPHESEKYRPWNRYDPDIPAHIRKKLVELEDDDSTSIGQYPQSATTPFTGGMLQGEISLKGVHGKYLSAQPDGRAEWNRDHASIWEYFHLEKRQGGKVALKGAHGMYVSAQPDGSVQINRREAPPGGWEEFTVEDRGNDVVCLKSCHGKYLSAQQNGTAQWNRDHAPRGGWEDIQIEYQGSNSEIHDEEAIIEHPPKTSSQEKFEFIPVSEYDQVWDDSGSGAEQDVSVWRARVPAGCHLIGMTAKNGHSPPNFSTLVIRAGGSDIAPPDRFQLIWWQERGKRRFWCWRPIPPPGYMSLGDVGTLSETPPSRKDVVCVALGCLSPNRQPLGRQIWNDRGGGAPKDAAFFEQPGGTGLFRCSDDATHNKPHGEFPLPGQTSTRLSATQATNGIEILEAVVGKPVRFKINNRPSSNDAWVGIYPLSASDQDHGEENKRWKWLRNIDVNNASLPKQAEGDWSIRVFSDGGHTLHERKDFAVKTGKAEPLDPAAVQSTRKTAWITLVIGIILFSIGLPLFIGGHSPAGEQNLGMIIPGAILFGVGAFLAVVASFILISSWAKSYAETGKPAPRWTKTASVLAAFLLIPGIALVVIGSISTGTIHHEETAPARLWITDTDGMGDQGFIIFIEAPPGDFDNNGIHDYCEFLTVNATHSGLWMSDPWTSQSKQNDADPTRQVFELEIAHDGSGCDANVWPEQKAGNLVKLGRACYGCMAGYTDISASIGNISYQLPMWIQDGEKVVEATGVLIAGSIMFGLSFLSLIGLHTFHRTIKGNPVFARKDPMAPAIEVLEAIEEKPVRFRINDPPRSSSAWVGIYPFGAKDEDHGEEGERWKWLRDIDVTDASFPARRKGMVSIRVFSDGGHTVHSREDFDILPKKERWWED